MGKECCCHDCGCNEKHTRVSALQSRKETVKVYFCPKCGSKEVGFVFRFANAFGVIPKMECKKCKLVGGIFPLLVVDKESLNKENSKVIKSIKKKTSKKRGKN